EKYSRSRAGSSPMISKCTTGCAIFHPPELDAAGLDLRPAAIAPYRSEEELLPVLRTCEVGDRSPIPSPYEDVQSWNCAVFGSAFPCAKTGRCQAGIGHRERAYGSGAS